MNSFIKFMKASFLGVVLGSLSISTYANVYLTDTVQVDGIAYFLSSDGGIIYRYDTRTKQYLESWDFEGRISDFEISNDRLYYSINQTVYERLLASDTSVEFTSLTETIENFVISGQYLVVSLDRSIVNIDLIERTQISSLPISCATPVYNKKHKTAYCLNANNGTLNSIVFSNDGIMSIKAESEYGAAMYHKGLYNMPGNEDLVLSGSGVLFNAVSLRYEATLSEPFESLAYDNQNTYTLSLEKVFRFNHSMRPTGQIDLPRLGNIRLSDLNQSAITYSDGALYIFLHDFTNHTVLTASDSEFTEVIPTQLNALYPKLGTIEHAKSKDGSLIYLLADNSYAIHRWDVHNNRYLQSINFDTKINTISYDTVLDLLYVGLQDGRILKVLPDLSAAYFNRTPYFIYSILAMNGSVSVQDHALNISQYYFDSQGNLLRTFSDLHTSNITGNRFVTSSGDKVFQMKEYGKYAVSIFDTSGRYIDFINGGFYNADSEARMVSYNEADDLVLLNDGGIFNYLTSQAVASLDKNIGNGVWFGNTLVTSSTANNKTQVELWDENFRLVEAIELQEEIEEIIPINENEALFILNSGTSSHIELYSLEKIRNAVSHGKGSLCQDTCSSLESYFEGVESLVTWSGINNVTSLDMEINDTSRHRFSASTIYAGRTGYEIELMMANEQKLTIGITESQILLKQIDSTYVSLKFDNAALFNLASKQGTNNLETSFEITYKETGNSYDSSTKFTALVQGIYEINTKAGTNECLLIEYFLSETALDESFAGRICIAEAAVLTMASNPFKTDTRRWYKPGEEYILTNVTQGSPRETGSGSGSGSGGSLTLFFMITLLLIPFYRQLTNTGSSSRECTTPANGNNVNTRRVS